MTIIAFRVISIVQLLFTLYKMTGVLQTLKYIFQLNAFKDSFYFHKSQKTNRYKK